MLNHLKTNYNGQMLTDEVLLALQVEFGLSAPVVSPESPAIGEGKADPVTPETDGGSDAESRAMDASDEE